MQDLVYSIDIYPKGENAPKVTLVFDDGKDAKMEYVRNEHSYCLKEENDYQTAEHSKRKEKKDAFLKKRVEFAKKNGFSPKKGNPTIWIKGKLDEKNQESPSFFDDDKTPA